MVVDVACDGEGLGKKKSKRFDGVSGGGKALRRECKSIVAWSFGNHYEVGIPCSPQTASAPCHLNCSLPVSFGSVLGTLHL